MENWGYKNVLGEIIKNRYLVKKQLAKKNNKQTLLARDLKTKKLVIIKTLLFSDGFQWQDLKLFAREAETLKSLSHPAIPRYIDYFDLDRGFALVQNYIPAKTLQEHLTAGRTFSELEVKKIAKSILEIITYLQQRNPPVIHRDIKPSNILLAERFDNNIAGIYLIDFGSVRTAISSKISTTTIVGTYGYMPPEQYSGKSFSSSDIYSLGASLIYLVTGRHPLDLPQTDELKIDFEEICYLSSDFNCWLKKTVEPYPKNRFSSAKIALAELEKKAEPKFKIDNNSQLKLVKTWNQNYPKTHYIVKRTASGEVFLSRDRVKKIYP